MNLLLEKTKSSANDEALSKGGKFRVTACTCVSAGEVNTEMKESNSCYALLSNTALVKCIKREGEKKGNAWR